MQIDKKNGIEAECLVSKMVTLEDGTARLYIDLNEDVEAAKQFLGMIKKFGKLVFFPEKT